MSIEHISKITEFLNYFEKDFEKRMWENGEGYEFIIDVSTTEIKKKIIISISEDGYLDFEVQE